MESIEAGLIAPCGMNCALCMAYLRDKKPCYGCHVDSPTKNKSCMNCLIKNCPDLQGNSTGFCYECAQYPCKRLNHLDKRYRTKYHMSMIANLENIKENGMDAFLRQEVERWTCKECGQLVSVHRDVCANCKTPYMP